MVKLVIYPQYEGMTHILRYGIFIDIPTSNQVVYHSPNTCLYKYYYY